MVTTHIYRTDSEKDALPCLITKFAQQGALTVLFSALSAVHVAEYMSESPEIIKSFEK